MGISVDEKRRDPRLLEELPCDLHVRAQRLRVRVGNVSRHGLFIHTREPPPVAHVVALTLHLPGGRLDVMATVKRHVCTGFDDEGAGLALFALGGASRQRWESFVQSGADPGLLLTRAARFSLAEAVFVVQPPSVRALLAFFDDKIAPMRTLWVTPPVHQMGAVVEVVLVHPETERETVFAARVTALNPDRPGRMGIRFAPISRDKRQSFLASLGPLSAEDGRPLFDVALPFTGTERVTEYAFISPRLRGTSLDGGEPIDLVDVVSDDDAAAGAPNDEAPPELELVDSRELFDFTWDASKKK